MSSRLPVRLQNAAISLLKAKRAVERVAATGAAVPFLLPKTSDLKELFVELRQAGIKAVATIPQKEVNIRRLRKPLGYTNGLIN